MAVDLYHFTPAVIHRASVKGSRRGSSEMMWTCLFRSGQVQLVRCICLARGRSFGISSCATWIDLNIRLPRPADRGGPPALGCRRRGSDLTRPTGNTALHTTRHDKQVILAVSSCRPGVFCGRIVYLFYIRSVRGATDVGYALQVACLPLFPMALRRSVGPAYSAINL